MPGVLRVGAYVLLREDDKVLLCRLTGPTVSGNTWTLPGGGLEWGEHPETAAVREAWEETGLEVALEGLASIENFVSPKHQHLCIVYRAQVTGGELRPETGGSTEEVRWVTQDEAQALPLVELAEAGVKLAFL